MSVLAIIAIVIAVIIFLGFLNDIVVVLNDIKDAIEEDKGMTERLFDEVVQWQKETFPKATALSKVHHLKQEVDELICDLENDNSDRALEYADCILLIFGSAASDGMSYWEIINALKQKMEINYNREWGIPDVNGVVNHRKENQ